MKFCTESVRKSVRMAHKEARQSQPQVLDSIYVVHLQTTTARGGVRLAPTLGFNHKENSNLRGGAFSFSPLLLEWERL